MYSINYGEVNNTEIMTFLSVARTLSMSAAASELYVTQPAVSQRIRRLENKYGLILFVRSSNGLQLTPAGKAFYTEMNASFMHIESAFTKAFTAQSGTVKELTIGYDGFFDIPLLYEIIERFSLICPNVCVTTYFSGNESCEDIFTLKTDILMRPNSSFSGFVNYVGSEHISEYQFCILVANNNPLSSREHLSVKDIIGTPLTVAHINSDSPYIITLKNMFVKYGYSPRFETLTQPEMLAFNILASNGVAVASPSFWTRMNARAAAFFKKNIRVYPIEGEFYPVSFVWKTEGASPHIDEFLKVYRQVVSEGDNQQILWQSYNGY